MCCFRHVPPRWRWWHWYSWSNLAVAWYTWNHANHQGKNKDFIESSWCAFFAFHWKKHQMKHTVKLHHLKPLFIVMKMENKDFVLMDYNSTGWNWNLIIKEAYLWRKSLVSGLGKASSDIPAIYRTHLQNRHPSFQLKGRTFLVEFPEK